MSVAERTFAWLPAFCRRRDLISYTRGDVRIVRRTNLERAACKCYGLMQRQVRVWQGQTG
jgi:hypothetical protein